MGIDPAPQMANLYLYYYESSFMKTITKESSGIAKKIQQHQPIHRWSRHAQ